MIYKEDLEGICLDRCGCHRPADWWGCDCVYARRCERGEATEENWEELQARGEFACEGVDLGDCNW